MQTTFNIKNFRVFDENGVSVKLSPITFLTGCNSSGKSSVVKGLFLLNSFLAQIKKDFEDNGKIELGKYKLDFSTYPNSTLGRFDRVVHRSDNSDASLITLEYTIYSRYLSKEVTVTLTFCKDENDDLNNGYLKEFSMYVGEDLLYRSGCIAGEYCNLNLVKNDCVDFATSEFLAYNFCCLIGNYDIDGNVSKEEYESQKGQMLEYWKSIGRERCIDIFDHVRYSKLKQIIEDKKYAQALSDTKEKDSLFYIPVMNVLGSAIPSDFNKVIDSIVRDWRTDSERILKEKVYTDFMASSYGTFDLYFKAMEMEFLNNALNNCKKFPLNQNTPRCIDWYHLSIRQDYLSGNPSMWEDVMIFGDDCWLNEDEIKSENEKNKAEREKAFVEWKERSLTFGMLYEFIMMLNNDYCNSINSETSDSYEYVEHRISFDNYYSHYSYKALCIFMSNLVKECLLPEWVGSLEYVASTRVDVKRLYSLEDNSNFSSLLKRYFENKRVFLNASQTDRIESMQDYEVNSFINKWIREFGIGEKLSLDIDEEGLGVQIRLHKSPEAQGNLLADEGYGITQLVSILLEIETAIIHAKKRFNSGLYGLDYLPKRDNISEVKTTTIALEEPEIHLHPRYQSMLAEMFADAMKYGVHFVVETHSEYLIRKLQLLVADTKNDLHVNRKKVSILYVNDSDIKKRPQGEPHVKQIGICKDGYLDDEFGPGFFDVATSLSRELM